MDIYDHWQLFKDIIDRRLKSLHRYMYQDIWWFIRVGNQNMLPTFWLDHLVRYWYNLVLIKVDRDLYWDRSNECIFVMVQVWEGNFVVFYSRISPKFSNSFTPYYQHSTFFCVRLILNGGKQKLIIIIIIKIKNVR